MANLVRMVVNNNTNKSKMYKCRMTCLLACHFKDINKSDKETPVTPRYPKMLKL